MRKSLVRAVFCREGGARNRVLPPDLRNPPSTTGGSLCGQLAFLKPLFVFKKKKKKLDGAQKRAALPASAIPRRLPLLPSLFGFVSNLFGLFFGGCFSHETRPFPDLYCKLSCARARRTQRDAGTEKAWRARQFRIAGTQKG